MTTRMGEYSIIQGAILKKTQLALLFYHGEQEREVWIPFSMIGDDVDDLVVDDTEGVDLHVRTWFCREKELI